MKAHILAVDDDIRIRTLLADYLCRQGYAVHMAENAAKARALCALFRFDLIISDVMMPGEDGFAFTRALNADMPDAPPVILLTARGEPGCRVEGLESGAADYIPKPFEPKELLLRMRRLLPAEPDEPASPRAAAGEKIGAFIWKDGNLTKDGESVPLTARERELIACLAAHKGKEVSREELAERCGVNERSVDVAVTRLRKKLEDDPRRPKLLQTLRGKGYALYG